MNKRWFFLAVVGFTILIAGQVNASSIYAEMADAAVPEVAVDSVRIGDPFTIDIYMQNTFGSMFGVSIPMAIYGQDGLTDLTHRDVGGIVPTNGTVASITNHNGWDGYWNVLNEYMGFNWNGSMADTINFTGLTFSTPWGLDDSATHYYSFAFQIDQAGTICIDSVSIPDQNPPGKYDWLFDDLNTTFNGPYCWKIYDTIPPENDPPVFAALDNQVVDENVALNFGVSATDPNGDALTLTHSTLPAGAGFTDNGDGTGSFAWTPTYDQDGIYPVEFYASDGDLEDTLAISITVNNVNRPPEITVPATVESEEDSLLNFGVISTDPDGGFPTLSHSTLPSGAIFDDYGNGTANFAWTPTFEQAGVYEIWFYASDGEFTDSGLTTITITNVNRAPVLGPLSDTTIDESQELLFTVTATDDDGDPIALLYDGLPAGAGFTDNGDGTGDFAWTPGYDQAGDYPVTFYAADYEDTVSIAITITVLNVNRPPVLTPIDTQYVNENENLNFIVTATDDDGDPIWINYGGVLPAGAGFTDNGDGTGTFDWTPTYEQAGQYDIDFFASDGIDTVITPAVIIVNNVNRAPELDPIGPQATDEGQLLNFAVSASDPDGTIPTLTTSTLPVGAIFNDHGDGTGAFNWLPNFEQAGVYSVTFYADDGILPDSEVVEITVYDVPPEVQLTADPNFFEIHIGVDDSMFVDFMLVSELSAQNIPFWVYNEESWLYLDTIPYSPIVTPDTVGIFVSSVGLAPDVNNPYTDSVKIFWDVGGLDSIMIPVQLYVEPDVVVMTSPTEFNFTVTEGQVTNDSLFVYEAFDRNVEFVYSNSAPWLGIVPLTEPPYITPTVLYLQVVDSTLPPDTYYDTIFITEPPVKADGFETVAVPVTLTVEAYKPVVTVTPDSFTFTLAPDQSDNGSALVAELSGLNLAFGVDVMLTSSWLILDSIPGSMTPGSFFFTVSSAGLDTGAYSDTFVVYDPTNGPLGFDPVLVPVVLFVEEEGPPYSFTLSPPWLDLSYMPGESHIESTFVSEDYGRNVGFTVITHESWIEAMWSEVAWWTTPSTVLFWVDADGLAPGLYVDSVELILYPETDTVYEIFPVYLTVEDEVPPAVIMTDPIMFDWTLEQGVVAYDSLFVYDSLDRNIPFHFANSSSWLRVDPFWMPPTEYITPYDLVVEVNTAGLIPGQYLDTIFILPDTDGVSFPPVAVPAYLRVVDGQPENADSVWISTVPGVPGSDVVVPVYFRNFESLQVINLPLTWSSDEITLNEVTFDGTEVEYVDNKPVVIDNTLRKVQIGIVPTFTPDVDPTRGMLAKLHFSIGTGVTEALVTVDTTSIEPAGGLHFIDDAFHLIVPTFISGAIVIDTTAGFICGRVIDTAGNEIADAYVELWDDFPGGGVMINQMSDDAGQFACHTTGVFPFDAYAYKDGYYPGLVEDIQFGEIGVEIVLTPVSPVIPTNEWVDFYCDDNYFHNVPLPLGSVVDAYDPDGVHCGTWFVTETGKYGFMPVYRDDIYTIEDEGAEPGDTISFYINGYPAEATGERVWTQNGDNFEVCLNIFDTEEKCLQLRQGWNLISWNVDLPMDDVEDVFAPIMNDVIVILGYHQGGFTYDPVLPDFSTLWGTDHFHGYWVKMAQDAELCLTGTPVSPTTPIALTTGWNLVSYLPDDTIETPMALSSIVDEWLLVALGFDSVGQTYDPALPEYSTLDEMKRGFGYWLYSLGNVDLVYPGVGPSVNFRQVRPPVAAKGTPTDLLTSRNWMNLYAYQLTLDGRVVPEGTEVLAVDASGRTVGYATVGAEGKFGFMPVYADDPMTEAVDGITAGDQFLLVIDGVETEQTFTWTENGDRVEIDELSARTNGALLPKDYALGQNYPNPFNPFTSISFSVPKTMPVTIGVYNILGKKVAVIFDGIAEAGTNTAVWDGTDENGVQAASGVYFYRMDAGEFSESRKMVLMK